MRVLVCGSRHFNDYNLLEKTLDGLDISTIIQGEARGADTLAKQYAGRRGISLMAFPAAWDIHGKAAGPIRNIQMLTEGRPDRVVAFIGKIARMEFESGLSDSPYSRGTKHMIEIAEKAGVEVKTVNI